ncbi:MAG TPA: response regulator transcription factor [Candidatus Melainabacteria bacterium]|nr:response regulator transcription factor [Candidatus Melainabacteria bacterium]HIN65763.1 response regulator transcription factor [Candidatus Obscuribacterales bacterium]
MAKVLVVEDDPALQKQLEEFLRFEKHTVEAVGDGAEAAHRLLISKYDLVILDWNLPGMSGTDVLKKMRGSGCYTPVLMLTGKSNIMDKTEGFDSGADDYLTKPFDLKELGLRAKALLRRPQAMLTGTIDIGGVSLDPHAHKVFLDGQEIQMLPKEFALLEFFMRHPGQIFSQEALLESVWKSESESSIHTVYVHVRNLRKKLSRDGKSQIIKTVHNMGYKLELD